MADEWIIYRRAGENTIKFFKMRSKNEDSNWTENINIAFLFTSKNEAMQTRSGFPHIGNAEIHQLTDDLLKRLGK